MQTELYFNCFTLPTDPACKTFQNAHKLDAAVAMHFSPVGSAGGESHTVRGGRGFSRCGACGTSMDLKKSSSGR